MSAGLADHGIYEPPQEATPPRTCTWHWHERTSAGIAAAARAYADSWEIMPRRRASDGSLIDSLDGKPRTGLLGRYEAKAYWHEHPDTEGLAGVLGPQSGCFVVDIDQHDKGHDGLAELRRLEAEHGSLPPTPFVLSPTGGGRHLYFAWPAGQRLKSGNIAPGIEVLADRGAANLPPSRKPTRQGLKPYLWSLSRHPDYLPFADAPAWLLKLAEPPPPPVRTHRQSIIRPGSRYVSIAVERELEELLRAPTGQRNNTLARASWSLGRLAARGLIEAVELEDLLIETAEAIGLKRSEAQATVRSALRRRTDA